MVIEQLFFWNAINYSSPIHDSERDYASPALYPRYVLTAKLTCLQTNGPYPPICPGPGSGKIEADIRIEARRARYRSEYRRQIALIVISRDAGPDSRWRSHR